MPFYCQRCYVEFENDEDLNAHSRSRAPCTLEKQRHIEGINKAQYDALKDKGRMHKAQSEEDKWKIVYLILFPDTAMDEMPFPCRLLF
jgi:hypothetical protein